MKNILVPLDFSACSIDALKTAADLAHRAKAHLILLHVYERPIYGYTETGIDIHQEKLIRDWIEEQFNRLKEANYLKNISFETRVATDILIWESLKLDDMPTPDLVIMGSNGTRGMSETIVGSNASRMVRFSTTPVLVIKRYHPNFNPKRIVHVSNFFGEAITAFHSIAELRDLFDAEITLLKIVTPGKFETTVYSEQLIKNFAREVNLKQYNLHVYNDHSVEEGILHYLESETCDMFSIGTHGRTGLSHLISGSIAESVVNHVKVPILSTRIDSVKKSDKILFPS